MAQGTTSLVSNTVYALSDAATQFSKVAHKVPLHLIKVGINSSPSFVDIGQLFCLQGIVAFTFDDQAVTRMENQQKGEVSHSKGVINEVFQVYHFNALQLIPCKYWFFGCYKMLNVFLYGLVTLDET